MAITLTLEAQDADQMLSELERVSGVFAAARGGTAPARSAGAAQAAVLAEASDQWLLEELSKRFLARGFKVEVTELRAVAQADGPIPDARQADLGVDMSGDDEAGPVPSEPDEGVPPADATEPTPAPRKRGRPPGTKNKPKDEAPAGDTAEPDVGSLPLDEAHKKALALLAQVFGRGDAGQAAVRKVRDAFGVKKFGDVPMAQAHDMLRMAMEADAEVPVMQDAA